MDEDLSVFFDPDDFATAALYKAGGVGSGVSVNVIYDRAHLEVLEISSTGPVALAKAADFAGFLNTDTLAIGADVFRIVDSQPQGDGSTVMLVLELQ